MNAPVMPATAPVAGPALRDIHLPPEPSWWPPAPGWWLLAVIVVATLLALVWLRRRRRLMRRQEKHLLDELDRLVLKHQQDGNDAALAASLHQLLRRVARLHDASAARQRGEPWRQTLARVSVPEPVLAQLLSLEHAIYRPAVTFDSSATLNAARTWLLAAAKPRAWKRTVTEFSRV